jgi:group I intron endonuclease
MTFLLYKVTCRENGKVYIGITKKTAEGRWRAHCRAARSGKNVGSLLHAAIMRLGEDAFDMEALATFETWEDACAAECEMIKSFDSFNTGYNATKGGEGTIGFKPSAKTRALLSKIRRGKPKSEEHKAAIGAGNRGKVRSADVAAKCGDYWRGRKQSAESIEKRMIKIRGVPLSEEHREKLASARRGRPLTEAEAAYRTTPEYREKMRQASLKRWAKVKATQEAGAEL